MSRPGHLRRVSTNYSQAAVNRQLEGKLAIVTGASRGIGAATCANLASKGCSLVMNYTSDSSAERTEKLAKELQEQHGIKAITCQADLGSTRGPAYIVEVAKNNFGNPRSGQFQIDIIINNAGVSVNRPIEKCDAEDFTFQYNVNVLGPLLLIQAALPYLPNDRSGRIVNLSSVSSSLGFKDQSVYGGTKAALEAMTRTWARELAERATVNAINPGPVATDMYAGTTDAFKERMNPYIKNTPLAAAREGIDPEVYIKEAPLAGGRPGYEEEIAGIIAMLCSPEAGWSTGSVVCANGGMKFSV